MDPTRLLSPAPPGRSIRERFYFPLLLSPPRRYEIKLMNQHAVCARMTSEQSNENSKCSQRINILFPIEEQRTKWRASEREGIKRPSSDSGRKKIRLQPAHLSLSLGAQLIVGLIVRFLAVFFGSKLDISSAFIIAINYYV